MNSCTKFDLEESEIVNKRIIFVLDRSGSMSGKKIPQAKEALQFSVTNLNPDDLFDIVDFGSVTVQDPFPKELPDLFKGSQIIQFGRYANNIGNYRGASNPADVMSTQVRYVGNKTFFMRDSFWVDVELTWPWTDRS
ncbi:MAG: hypothetical protein ACE5HS_12735 [bacterium]